MAHKTEMNLDDLQMDERYKKLQRALKLAQHRRGNRKDGKESRPLSMSANISSIRMDASDSITKILPLQTSRVDSEIVSSSNNLRNMVSKKANTNSNKKVITASSIQNFDKLNNNKKGDYNDSDDLEDRRCRIFSKWIVALNEHDQLIIKGILKGGRIAQSKPIIRRLSINRVESLSKHIYQLEGDIADNGYELPDYVRGKFCNGFPYDWKNVYEIWTAFVQEGCRASFRWPTAIADSDDGLRSEVTNFTHARLKIPKDKKIDSQFSQTQSAQKDTQNSSHHRCETRDSSTQTCSSDAVREQENVGGNCPFNESNVDKLKDNLNRIVYNLAEIKCPQKCMSKVIEIFDCLNYVVSHGLIKDDDSTRECLRSEQDKCRMQEQSTLQNDIDSSKLNYENKMTQSDRSLKRKTTLTDLKEDKGKNSSDSESEVYAGIPKMSVEGVLRKKRTSIKPREHRPRRSSVNQNCDIMEAQHSSNVKVLAETSTSEDIGIVNLGDSTISSTEGKYEFYEVKSPNSESSKRRQWKRIITFSRDKSPHEAQDHFLQEKPRHSYRTSASICRSYATELNSDAVTSNDENENRTYQFKNRVFPETKASSSRLKNGTTGGSKRSVSNSDTFCLNVENEEAKSVLQKPRVKSIERVNIDIKKSNGPKKVKATSRKSVPGTSKVSKSNENKKDSKPELLSEWIPRVLSQPELHLIFEGQLLDKIGRVVHRNVQTDPILRRVSAKVVETIGHDLYELVGDLNDTKNVIPNKLVRQCRNGCPRKIEDFCKTWQQLQEVKAEDDTAPCNVTISSKGRRIVPPLSYWNGERITVNQTQTLYNPGDLKGIISLPSRERLSPAKHVEEVTKRRSRRISLKKRLEGPEVFNIGSKDSNTIASVSGESVNTKTSNLKRLKSDKHKGSVIKNEKRAVQQALCSSDSSDVENVPLEKRLKVKSNQQNTRSHREKRNKRDDQCM